jgi:hypothetical protein
MCIVLVNFLLQKIPLPEKDKKFTVEQNFNLLVCSSQKNHKLFFQFPFCSVCFRSTVTKLHFELLKLNIKVCFHMCVSYRFTWLTADMCCLSYWSVSKPYFLSLPVLLVFTLVLSASRKGRSKTLLLHFVKTENWSDATFSCHMNCCLQWSTLCVSVLLYFQKSDYYW